MAVKLPTTKVVANNPVPSEKAHLYKFKVTGDYEWGYVEVSGATIAEATQMAIDEHFRQNGVLPVSTTFVSQIS